MFEISFFVDKTVWICLAVAVLAAITTFVTRFYQVWLAGSAVKPDSETDKATDSLNAIESYSTYERTADGDFVSTELEVEHRYSAAPLLSVIVYSRTKEDETTAYLQTVMEQDYPNFEVILVNEGSAETTYSLRERLLGVYPERLHVTFIPHDAQNLSRRKLAQTIGIKAAKGEVVLTTMSNCRIPSRHWLSQMMAPFVDSKEVEIVLGYTHVDFSDLKGMARWYRGMDATLSACQWVGAAEEKRPYRGDGANLAFKRSLFFSAKGYSRTIHLMNGDDDIFLRQIMSPGNTRTAISPGSILTTEWETATKKVLADLKERYVFTSRFLPKWPTVRSGIGNAAQWLLLLACAAAVLLDPFAVVPVATAGGILGVTWLIQVLIYRRSARRLESVCLWWALPWFLLWYPVGNWLFRRSIRSHTRKNYTLASISSR